jgi:hypothetical protein
VVRVGRVDGDRDLVVRVPVLLVAGRDGAAHLSKRSLPAWRFRRKRQVDLGCNAYGHLAFFVMDAARAPQRG